MFNDSGLIKKIKVLNQIKPFPDWVVLTKNRILEQTEEPENVLGVVPNGDWDVVPNIWARLWSSFPLKPVFAFLILLVILTGAFGFAQSSLPGDFLYPVKRAAEKSQAVFISDEGLPRYNLEIANKRLEEATEMSQRIAERPKRLLAYPGELQKRDSIISEFQANISQAAKHLVKADAEKSGPDTMTIKEIVEQTKKIEENKQKAEKLGVIVGGTDDLNNVLSIIVQREIENLEKTILIEDQQAMLEEIKQDYEQGDYAKVLEEILLLSYPQP